MRKIVLIMALCCFLMTSEGDDVKTNHFSSLWGRIYQGSIGYKYLAFGEMSGIQNLQITYGMWDKNKMGIFAEVLFPFNQVNLPQGMSRLSAINLFWIYDIAITKIISIAPKIGYGLSVANYGSKNHLVWKPSFGLDLSFELIKYLALYLDYDYSFYHIDNYFSHLNYFGLGLRVKY
ncbi:hypothetical protein [Helicobacter anatolicus]|uniref:hypothetical protein n=1 Tax=Helicobacter anatolicus TaxID=2905874 RepID=UPI001E587E73|nr:hypothetical protein [Helicobacter anatolicus]MCE3039728.1 hypothetical protein [Helicobacter anatolicus]